MTKLRSLLALLVMLPLIALGSTLGSADIGSSAPVVPNDVGGEIGGGASYDCCWVFHMGRWYCIPC